MKVLNALRFAILALVIMLSGTHCSLLPDSSAPATTPFLAASPTAPPPTIAPRQPLVSTPVAIPTRALSPTVTSRSSLPRIINHPRPLSVDRVAFAQVGCVEENVYDFRLCPSTSPLTKLGCDEFKEAPDLLGGLSPSYPIAFCMKRFYAITDTLQTNPAHLSEKEYFYNYNRESGGVRLPFYTRYVIYRDKEFELIKSKDEFRQIYAPIETPDEALSYALALEKWTAYYGLAVDPKNLYFTATLEDTHVQQVPEGYVVNLYNYRELGCGPHWTTMFNIKIAFDGLVQVLDQTNVFKNPLDDSLCLE